MEKEKGKGKGKGKASSSGHGSARGAVYEPAIVNCKWRSSVRILALQKIHSYFDNLLWMVKQALSAYYMISSGKEDPNFSIDELREYCEKDPQGKYAKYVGERLLSHVALCGLKPEGGARYYTRGFSLIDGNQEDRIIAKLNYCPVIGLLQTCYEEYLELGKDDIYGFPPPKKRLDRETLEEKMLAPPLENYTWSPVLLIDHRKFRGVNVWIGLSSLGDKHADNGYLHILRKSSMKKGQENLLYQVHFPDQQIELE